MPDEPPHTSTPLPAKQSTGQTDLPVSADELVDKIFPQTNCSKMCPAHVYLGEDILVSGRLSPRVDVVHYSVDLEVCDHLVDIIRDDERMSLSGRLEYVGSGNRLPIVLEIAPAAFQHEAMHRLRMAMTRQDAAFGDLQKVHPIAMRTIEAERPEPDILGLRDPQPIIIGDCIGDNDLRQRILRERKLVRHACMLVRGL